ncbi:MAG: nickel insertion protein [Planctomycetota bacterium]|jgi:uncharacterized protein (DUF111 family)
MEKEGILLITQIDHLTGEDIGWALEALDVPGIRNRNLISTLTKKGRMGHLLLLDLEPEAEADVGALLFEVFGTHGYHRIQTHHVYKETVIEEISLIVQAGVKSLQEKIRVKRKKGHESGPFFIESDSLYILQKRIHEELGVSVSPLELRRQIEVIAEKSTKEPFKIAL